MYSLWVVQNFVLAFTGIVIKKMCNWSYKSRLFFIKICKCKVKVKVSSLIIC